MSTTKVKPIPITKKSKKANLNSPKIDAKLDLMQQLLQQTKPQIVEKFGGNINNTGEASVQVALFTQHISQLTIHLKTHRKDFSTTRSLLKKVGQRRRLLKYISKKDIVAYRQLIEQLGIRK